MLDLYDFGTFANQNPLQEATISKVAKKSSYQKEAQSRYTSQLVKVTKGKIYSDS
jgi:hypothetical protein